MGETSLSSSFQKTVLALSVQWHIAKVSKKVTPQSVL